jgi:cell wall-associated NlpC family hydrolase
MAFDEVKFHNITRRYVDCLYGLGKKDPRVEGFDCLTMLKDFYEEMGATFPEEWNGWNAENYAERWENGEGRKEFVEFLMTLGSPIEKNYMRRGDLIIYEGTLSGPAIYLGNGLAILVLTIGGRVHSMRALEPYILSIRRLI